MNGFLDFLSFLQNSEVQISVDFMQLLQLPDNAITVSHFRIGGSSLVFVSYLEKLLVEKFLLMGLSDEFRRDDLVITELATKLRKLGTLGTSAIEVRVSQRTTCCLPDNASVLVS